MSRTETRTTNEVWRREQCFLHFSGFLLIRTRTSSRSQSVRLWDRRTGKNNRRLERSIKIFCHRHISSNESCHNANGQKEQKNNSDHSLFHSGKKVAVFGEKAKKRKENS